MHGVLYYRPSQHACVLYYRPSQHACVLYYRPSQHACDFCIEAWEAFDVLNILNMVIY